MLQELNLKLDKLTKESNLKRQALDNEVIDTQTTQVELEKTSDEFRKAHQERQQLISQWENTIDQMKRRDEDINNLNEVTFVIIFAICINLSIRILCNRLSTITNRKCAKTRTRCEKRRDFLIRKWRTILR